MARPRPCTGALPEITALHDTLAADLQRIAEPASALRELRHEKGTAEGDGVQQQHAGAAQQHEEQSLARLLLRHVGCSRAYERRESPISHPAPRSRRLFAMTSAIIRHDLGDYS